MTTDLTGPDGRLDLDALAAVVADIADALTTVETKLAVLAAIVGTPTT